MTNDTSNIRATASKPQNGTVPKPHQFLSKIISPSELKERKILLFGPSGAGKTAFIGSAAYDKRTAPILVLDFEGGGSTLAGMQNEDLKYSRIRDWNDFTLAYDYLTTQKHGFKSIAIDSISETHVYSLLDVIEYEVEHSARREDINAAEQSDYGKSMIQMRRFLRHFRDLPLHVFFTSLPKSIKSPREGLVQVPALFGQMAEEVIGMFDATIYLTQTPMKSQKDPKKTIMKRVLSLQNNPHVRSKVRMAWNQKIDDNLVLGGINDSVTKLFDMLGIE